LGGGLKASGYRAGDKATGYRAGDKASGYRAGDKASGYRAGEKASGSRAGDAARREGAERRREYHTQSHASRHRARIIEGISSQGSGFRIQG
jgi:hypothetical protein